MSQATFGAQAAKKSSRADQKVGLKDPRRKVTVATSVQDTLYNEKVDRGDRADKKSGFGASRKQSHFTYGSFTEQAAVSGGFGIEGGKSVQSRTNYKSRVGVSESDFFG